MACCAGRAQSEAANPHTTVITARTPACSLWNVSLLSVCFSQPTLKCEAGGPIRTQFINNGPIPTKITRLERGQFGVGATARPPTIYLRLLLQQGDIFSISLQSGERFCWAPVAVVQVKDACGVWRCVWLDSSTPCMPSLSHMFFFRYSWRGS